MLVLNQNGEIHCYYVNEDYPQLLSGFIRLNPSGTLVTLDTENYRISGKPGNWMATDDIIIDGKQFYLMEHNLVMATTFGNPIGTGAIRGQLKKLIEEHNLPPVVFHSLRHSSVTYKLKLNGGDIKAVQGDSGHSQVDMVTDVYSHIIDEDRRRNAELFEEAFYEKKNLDPKMREETTTQTVDVPDDVDAELLAKILANPEMKALLASLAKAMK